MPSLKAALALCALGTALAVPADLHADTVAGPPPAQKILVITGSDSMNDFVTFINQTTAWWSCARDYNGSGFLAEVQIHNQTVQTTVPPLATLQTYDQVWDLRFSAANCQGTVAACGTNGISAAQQADYLSYIAGGGSLFLMGDNGGYPGRNLPIQQIANTVDASSAFQTTVLTTNNDTQQGAYLDIAAATAAENFQSDYRDMTGTERWVAAQYNGLVSTWGSAYPILKDNLTGLGTAFAFDCGNMKPAYQAGKLEIVFDWQMMGGGGQVGYCPPYLYSGTTFGNNERFWENSIDFLVPGSACTTPTPTRTATPTATRTATRTASPTATVTPSATPSVTASSTRTSSPSPSATPSVTATVTPSVTYTVSSTRTATPTATASVTESATRTASPTATVTRTATETITVSFTASPPASATNTPTATPTFTITLTATASSTRTATPTASPSYTSSFTPSPIATATNTPTATPTFTITLTATETMTRTSTPSATPSSTESPVFSPTSTPTFTATPSATPSFTATDTRTASPTATPSATETVTWTATPSATPSASPTSSFTDSPTRTVSPTITQTPVPVPFHITARVYNEAGELVRLLYDGAASLLPQALSLDRDAFVGGQDQVSLLLPGVLSNAPLGVAWNGANGNGQLVDAGSYYVKLESSDQFGNTQSYIKPVIVVPSNTETWLRLLNEAGETVWHQPVSAAVTGLSLSSESVALDGEGHASGAPVLKLTLQLAGGGTQVVDWYGTNDQGALLDSGVYQVSVSSTQPGQSATVNAKKLNVIRGADADLLGTAVLGPNPARGVDHIDVRYASVAGMSGAYAELYTLAGGRVTSGMDPLLTGSVRLELGNLSGGVYLCVVKLGSQRRVIKVAVVR